jgi:outer membrane receptor protein involved in Fe transport
MSTFSPGPLIRSLAILPLALLLALTSSAQTFRGGITGVVTDQLGSVIAGAHVDAVDSATGVNHSTISSSGGEFTFQDLPLGAYAVTAVAPGFQTLKVDKVPVSAGSIYNLPLKLSVASAATTIEVDAAGLSLDTTTTTQTTVLESKSVQDTPLNGRDFTQLIILSPGFTNSGAGGYGSMNGTRANQMNWQIDGIDNNDLWHNIPAVNQGGVSGIAGVVLPIDAVEQFSAQTQAAPESGRNPGGTVNLSLKSGTNRLHGSLYYYNRNEALGAKSPFTSVKQKVRNYNYGLSVGGPIIKDKLFYFVTYEHQRFVIGVPANATEPSAAYQAQATALLAANGVSVNPVSSALLTTLWPASALTGPASPNNFYSNDPEFGYSYNGTAKVDYTINDRNSLSAHWFVGQGNQVAPVSGSHLLPFYEVAPIHVQNYALVFNHVFSPSITNQLLAGVNYFNQVFNDNQTGFDVASLGLVTGSPFTSAPNIQISHFDQVGKTPPEGRNDITGHLTEDLAWTVGKHQFKFGGEYRQAQLDEFYHRHATGTFVFDGTRGNWGGDDYTNALADFLAGYVKTSSIAIGDPGRQVFVNTYSVFAQDAWQLSTKLNVNYGLRWDYEGPLHNSNKDLSVFRPSLGGIEFQGAGISSVYDPKYTDFSPRVGFSYQVAPRLVVRGGSGLYFDTPNLNPFLDNRPGNNAPNGLEGNPAGPNPVFNVSHSAYTIVSGQPVFPTTGSCSVDQPCGIYSIAKSFQPSYNINYNFQIEQSLNDKVFFQLGYVGSEGRHLLSIVDINQALPQDLVDAAPGYDPNTDYTARQQAARPFYSTFPQYGNINEIQSIGNSNYNSLQAVLRIANYHSLSVQGAYTWSHSFDDVTSYRGALPQDSTNFKGDYGNSDFDNRNTFVGLVSYEVPGSHFIPLLSKGWQANSLLTFHGGPPITVLSSSDTSGTDEGTQRANQVGSPYAGFRKAAVNVQWLNPAAFEDAAPGTYGTSHRNAYYAPGYSDVDLSIFKNTPIGEKINTQFRVEIFNLFNHTNYAPPFSSNGFYNPNTASNGSFQLTDTVGDFNGAPGIGAGEPFNTQLALKITF